MTPVLASRTEELATRQMVFESRSTADTVRIGGEIAAMLKPPCLLILRGSLGAGKTTLVKGIAQAFQAAEPDEVTSPTFTLIHEYEGTRREGGLEVPLMLYHLDLYRLESERQVDALGLSELAAPDAILLVEWGEKFPAIVRRSQGEIVMEALGGDARKITLTFK